MISSSALIETTASDRESVFSVLNHALGRPSFPLVTDLILNHAGSAALRLLHRAFLVLYSYLSCPSWITADLDLGNCWRRVDPGFRRQVFLKRLS